MGKRQMLLLALREKQQEERTVPVLPSHLHPQLRSSSVQLGYLHKNLVWRKNQGQKRQEEARLRTQVLTPHPCLEP